MAGDQGGDRGTGYVISELFDPRRSAEEEEGREKNINHGFRGNGRIAQLTPNDPPISAKSAINVFLFQLPR
jgi:hypothetical protein